MDHLYQQRKEYSVMKCSLGKVRNQEKFEYKHISTGKGRSTCRAFTKMVNVIYATRLGADTSAGAGSRKIR